MGRGLLPPGGGAWDGSLSLRPDSPVLPWSCALLQLIKFKISQHSPISAPEGPWVHFAFRVEVHPFLSGHHLLGLAFFHFSFLSFSGQSSN